MGIEQPAFTNLDKSFREFLDELKKAPISESKKKEIEEKLKEAFLLKQYEIGTTKVEKAKEENLIQLDMQKLNKGSSILQSKHIQHSAIRWASGLALSSAGLLFITIGFILIVTPATPEFEIATIFYFNEHDGVTVMDLFALVIIFMGIYLFIRAFISKEKGH
jgi:hypothetical protein